MMADVVVEDHLDHLQTLEIFHLEVSPQLILLEQREDEAPNLAVLSFLKRLSLWFSCSLKLYFVRRGGEGGAMKVGGEVSLEGGEGGVHVHTCFVI